jgi:uncharacterized iron-regulated membrane protein
VRTLVNLHFGRFGGMTGKVFWIIFGLIPTVLFVSGLLTWWLRIRGRRGAQGEPAAADSVTAGAPAAVAEEGARS